MSLKSLTESEHRMLERAMTALDVCDLLGIVVPERRRPDYGSGMAGGSQLEGHAQSAWDHNVRIRNRARIRSGV